MNFLALILKYSYILSKESFTYISGNRNLQQPAQAQKKKKSTPGKISYTSGSKNPRKTVLYLLKIKLFLYFRKRKLERETLEKDLIFQEVTCKAWESKISYAFSYKELKVSKLKYFFITIIKHLDYNKMSSHSKYFLYTQQAFVFYLLRYFCNVQEHIVTFFFCRKIFISSRSLFCSLYLVSW